MQKIRTARLELVLRSLEEWRAVLAAMPAEHLAQVSPEWLARMEAAAQPDPWLHGYTAFADGKVVGQCAFKSPPRDGMVEIAYAVEPECEGQGYATEMAAALTDFALASPQVDVVRAHTLVDGIASQRVLRKCGFLAAGEVQDPEDGTVARFEKRRPAA
jgi:[ribosomal protein S5]-alanine N-acetyltransferase